MATQMTSARRGVATDEMKQVAKDEDVSLDWLIPKIARGSIIIPSNNVRPQKIHNVGIGKGMKTKVNVNIGTSTLNVNLDEEIEKAKVAIKYHADTMMDLSDGGDVKKIRQTLMDNAPITFCVGAPFTQLARAQRLVVAVADDHARRAGTPAVHADGKAHGARRSLVRRRRILGVRVGG